jgi:hypothetical protein
VISENFSNNLMKELLDLKLDYWDFDDYHIVIKWTCKKDANYEGYEYWNFLRDNEKEICNKLHIPPEKYLRILICMIKTDREFESNGKEFTKIRAQESVTETIKINVNKICKLYEIFEKYKFIRR